MVLAQLIARALAVVVIGCGSVHADDVGSDAMLVHDASGEGEIDGPEVCDSPAYGTCCVGKSCNGFCVHAPQGDYCGCGGSANSSSECPAAMRCCFDSHNYDCVSASKCVTCAAVGTATGFENCCGVRPYDRYCRGICGDASANSSLWCACGDRYGTCQYGADLDSGLNEVCCPFSDGGMGCVNGTKCP